MTISIITPSYNQGQFIEQTIRSVLSQDKSLAYFVIDGGSSDDTVEVIKRYESDLIYWVSEPDNGQSHAINKGIKRANGKIFNWLNSDDYYEPKALETVVRLFEPGVNCVAGRSRLFNGQGTIKLSSGTDYYLDNLPKTIGWARIDQPETFFSKEAWDKVGLLNEDLHYCMDREWWIRYLYHFGLHGFKQTDQVLVNFRIHENSKTQTAQPGFKREHHTLFYAMGKAAKWIKACAMMETQLDIDLKLETSICSWTNQQLASDSFNYYLLKTANEFYAQEDLRKARSFLKHVKSERLASADRPLFFRLKWRTALPISVIRLFRR